VNAVEQPNLTDAQMALLRRCIDKQGNKALADVQGEVEELYNMGLLGQWVSRSDLGDWSFIGVTMKGFELLGEKPRFYAHPDAKAIEDGILSELAHVPDSADKWSFADILKEHDDLEAWFYEKTSELGDPAKTYEQYLDSRLTHFDQRVADIELELSRMTWVTEEEKDAIRKDPARYALREAFNSQMIGRIASACVSRRLIRQLIRMVAEARLGCHIEPEFPSKEEEEVEPAA
jgi:hypothetical protein